MPESENFCVEEMKTQISEIQEVILGELGVVSPVSGKSLLMLEKILMLKFSSPVFCNPTTLIITSEKDANFVLCKKGLEEIWRVSSPYYGLFISAIVFSGNVGVFDLINKGVVNG